MCSEQEEVSFDFGIDFDSETNTEFMKETDTREKAQATNYKENSYLKQNLMCQ